MPTDPQWDNDPGMKQFAGIPRQGFPGSQQARRSVIVGYGFAQTMVQVLKQCGDNLTRENIMKQAANLKDFRTEVLLPGITINTSPDQFRPDHPASAEVFKGERWVCSAMSSAAKSAAEDFCASVTTNPRGACRRGFSFAARGWITASLLHV